MSESDNRTYRPTHRVMAGSDLLGCWSKFQGFGSIFCWGSGTPGPARPWRCENLEPSTLQHVRVHCLARTRTDWKIESGEVQALECNPHIGTTQELTALTLLTYAVYTATNHLRQQPLPPRARIYDALAQWTREVAKGHPHASRVQDNRWNRNATDTHLPPIPHNI